MIGMPRPTAGRAIKILREVFGQIRGPVAFRLWDGQELRLGADEPVCTAVIKSPETFVRLVRNPTPYAFAEAYVDSALDLEGDMFPAMEVANALEELKLSPLQKLRILLSLWRR